jgi:hypothetical protein
MVSRTWSTINLQQVRKELWCVSGITMVQIWNKIQQSDLGIEAKCVVQIELSQFLIEIFLGIYILTIFKHPTHYSSQGWTVSCFHNYFGPVLKFLKTKNNLSMMYIKWTIFFYCNWSHRVNGVRL